jgi:hypothetical protein
MERSLQFHNSADSITVMNELQHSSLYPDWLLANHRSAEHQHHFLHLHRGLRRV